MSTPPAYLWCSTFLKSSHATRSHGATANKILITLQSASPSSPRILFHRTRRTKYTSQITAPRPDPEGRRAVPADFLSGVNLVYLDSTRLGRLSRFRDLGVLALAHQHILTLPLCGGHPIDTRYSAQAQTAVPPPSRGAREGPDRSTIVHDYDHSHTNLLTTPPSPRPLWPLSPSQPSRVDGPLSRRQCLASAVSAAGLLAAAAGAGARDSPRTPPRARLPEGDTQGSDYMELGGGSKSFAKPRIRYA